MIRGRWWPAVRGLARVAPRLRPDLPKTGLASLVRATANRSPDAIVWRDPARSVTYADLWHLVREPVGGTVVAQFSDQFDLAVLVLRCQWGGGELVIVPQRAGTLAFDRALAEQPGAVAVRALAEVPARTSARGRGTIRLMTSGSTGQPVPHTLRTGMAAVPLMLGLLGSLKVPRRPRVGCLTRIDRGHGLALFAATLALGGSFDAGASGDAFDLLSGVPTQLAALPHVRAGLVLSGSDRLDPTLVRALEDAYGCPVVDAYGATEIGTVAVDGRPMPGVRVRVLDAAGRPVPDGTEGTLEITSPMRREPFTSDRGYVSSGRLHVTGRADDILVSAGENLSGALLLAWATEQADIADAALCTVPDDKYGARLRLTLTTETPLDAVRARIRATLGAGYGSALLEQNPITSTTRTQHD